MKILIVDDHQFIVNDLMDEIQNLLPDAVCIGTVKAQEVMNLMKEYQFDIIFMDIEMPGTNGISLARKILAQKPKTNIIYVTGYGKYALESYSTYASAFLEKPISTEKSGESWVTTRMTALRYSVATR